MSGHFPKWIQPGITVTIKSRGHRMDQMKGVVTNLGDWTIGVSFGKSHGRDGGQYGFTPNELHYCSGCNPPPEDPDHPWVEPHNC